MKKIIRQLVEISKKDADNSSAKIYSLDGKLYICKIVKVEVEN